MKTTTFLAIAASISGAVATFKKAPKFDCPRSTDNKCEEKQKNGFDWEDLSPGDFSDYHGFKFKGFKCEDKPNKRDAHLSPRTGKKALTGRCGSSKEVSPSFGCDQSKGIDKFSIMQIDITTEFDTDLEFHYDMPDGKQCKHRSRCSKGGSTVPNSQCGGAKNVTIVYPPAPNPPKPDCGISVHEIKFDCNPPEPPKPPKNKPPKETKTPPSPPKETYTPPKDTYTPPGKPPGPPKETYSPPEDTSKVDTPPPQETYPSSTYKFPPQGPRPTGPPKPDYTPQPPSKPEPPTKLPELPCPDVVPSCLNTWLFTVGCFDNTDAGCYCPDVAFVQNIFTCIYAYGQSDIIISQAVVFFQGICAPHAPKNPAIVTGAETITKVITETAAPTIPATYTTVVVTATEVVPCTTDGVTTETTTIYEQTVEVPEVGFQTGDSGDVGVVATTPEALPVVEEPTPVAEPPAVGETPATTYAVPTPDGSGAPSSPVIVAGAGKVAGSGLAIGAAMVAAIFGL